MAKPDNQATANPRQATLHVWDTMTGTLRPFEPYDQNSIRVYVCGPTVYDDIHVGNARPLVVYDTLVRLLRNIYGAQSVTYVRNITDIDDKIIQRSIENGRAIHEITDDATKDFHRVCTALSCQVPDHEPRASAHIKDIQDVIERLLARNMAYIEQDHVYFDVLRDQGYGRLSGRRGNSEHGRIGPQTLKRNAEDFVLWKPSSGGLPGWDSPWGFGRPGWHIECSAMSHSLLGLPFDIHGGGLDLIFPHHENEVAQSCAAFDTPDVAKYWMHNGFVMLNGKKMSKSLGNFLTAHDALEEHSGCALRLALLQSHYRAPCVLGHDQISAARNTLDRWYDALRFEDNPRNQEQKPRKQPEAIGKFKQSFYEHLANDIDTPCALALMSDITNQCKDAPSKDRAAWCSLLRQCGTLLGVLNVTSEEWFQLQRVGWRHRQTPVHDAIVDLIAQREQARNKGLYQDADDIRHNLQAMGVSLLDHPSGTRWQRDVRQHPPPEPVKQ